MPKVNSKGEPIGSYGYNIGGGTEAIPSTHRSHDTSVPRNDDFPMKGETGRQDPLNTNRFTTKKDSADPAKMTDMRPDPYAANGFRKGQGNLSGGGWLAEHQKKHGK